MFEKQGDCNLVGTVGLTTVQGDLKFAMMDNIAVGISGNASIKRDDNSNSYYGDGSHYRKNQFAGGEVGYFNQYKNFHFDFFGGWGKGYSETRYSIDNVNYLHSDSEQFSGQCDFALKNTRITKKGRWFNNAVGFSLIYNYNKIDNSWNNKDRVGRIFTEHFVDTRAGGNFFYRFGGQKFQIEFCDGISFPTNSENYGNSDMFQPETALFTVNFIFNISSLYQK
jgi:hypothetical protein